MLSTQENNNLIWAKNIFESYVMQYNIAFTAVEKKFQEREKEISRKITVNKNAIQKLADVQDTLFV